MLISWCCKQRQLSRVFRKLRNLMKVNLRFRIFLGTFFFASAMSLLLLILYKHTESRERLEKVNHWPSTVGSITGTQKVQIFKGQGTSIQGTYTVSGRTYSFHAFMGRDTWIEDHWQSPQNIPTVGDTIRLFYNPNHPEESVLDTPISSWNPGAPIWLVLGVSLLLAIVFWFGVPKKYSRKK